MAVSELHRAPTGISERGPDLLPLDAGEQYRFTFAMDACIGCHSCEVACAEQNDTPVDVAWRKVGELEGGTFPTTRRFNLSMACNHCLEPTCLSGCPTNAYVKLDNGVVRHDADECIGCQYCIWNCPYEVPVFDRARRVVSKCDMCLPRLEAGQHPACVLACPTKAIGVEKVDVAAWRKDHTAADGPGLPPSDITLSTTRVTLPHDLPDGTVAVDDAAFEPEDPHWPLIALTLLTQLSVGAVATTAAFDMLGDTSQVPLAGGAVAAFVSAAVALAASLLHLGRPAAALKALRNLRTSWLSREVALFSAFAGVSFAYAWAWSSPAAFPAWLPRPAIGGAATLLGAAGVYASGRLYLVPARPVWDSGRTLVAFFCTAGMLGPALALLCLDRSALGTRWTVALVALVGLATVGQLAVHGHLVWVARRATDRQHRATVELLLGRFRIMLAARVLAAAAGVGLVVAALPAFATDDAAGGRLSVAFAVLGLGELAGRYLFYVTVVPYRVAGTFVGARR